MRLIGMLDSPYVRRVAVSLRLLGIPFDHQSISVFRQMPAFQAINPLVKAPTLVTDDGLVLMDSTLILDHLAALAPGPLPRMLMPAEPAACRQALRVIGLALAACEKTVQIVYETQLRPAEHQHAPWLDRVGQQAAEAFRLLEAELQGAPLAVTTHTIGQDGISSAVAWSFAQLVLPGRFAPAAHPALAAHSAAAEALPAFASLPQT
jgi:glutathione S-transferase